MNKKLSALFAITLVLCACSEKPIQTEIDGLDLSKEQDIDYFRDRYELSRKFNEWCLKNMLEPIPKDNISKLFYYNCQTVNRAVMWPHKSIEKSRTYKSY